MLAPGENAADALLYAAPRALFVAHRPDEVDSVLAAAEAARMAEGGSLAGYIAYEAGLALEPKLAGLAAARSGAAGPLVWLGLFDPPTRIAASDVPGWLAARAEGSGTLGPMEPQLSPGGYAAAFDALREGDPRGRYLSGEPHLPPRGDHSAAIRSGSMPRCAMRRRRGMAG
jgi:para-aminobenzoate synthetase/4-amino-4-deoxychorismate lyase